MLKSNMDNKELQTKNQKELKKLLAVNQEAVRDLRFKDSNKQLKNIRKIRETKRLIARILTILNKQQ